MKFSTLSQFLARSLAMSCLAIILTLSVALAQQPPTKEYEPQVGQQGKDVIWVPTPQTLVNKMLDMAKMTSDDYVIDLGSGDGRTVITAAKRGAKALGIEYNPDMVELSKRNAAKEGVSDNATFVKADLFESDFSRATVITMFLLPDINVRLRPKILDMKPGTRVVSNSFDMGDWEADQTVQAGSDCTSWCRAYLWIVPAKVEGQWKLPDGELKLEQKYQMISGTLRTGGVVIPVTNGKVTGDQIAFTAGRMQYSGRVNGNVIDGLSKPVVSETKWRATRGNK